MHRKNKTLIILTPGFPASAADSTCLPMQQHFVKSLKQLYPDLNIIVLSFQYPYVVQTYTWFDITVMSFNGQNKGGLGRLLLRRKVNAALKQISHNNSIAGLISFWYNECAWVGKKFADKNKLKHFCWILGQDARPGNIYPRSLHLPAGELVALSDFLQDEFEKNYGTKPAFVIPPGTNSSLFKTNINKRDIDLLAAGSLISLKQFKIFIEAVAVIKKQLPGIQAILIGDGPEKQQLEKKIEEQNLRSNITLTGEIPYPEVLQWMQRARIFLHPSAYEGFSGVCQEAQAAGARVISFCKPMKQDIQNWNIVQDKNEMTALALNLLQQPVNDIDKNIPYSMHDTVKRMMKLFDV